MRGLAFLGYASAACSARSIHHWPCKCVESVNDITAGQRRGPSAPPRCTRLGGGWRRCGAGETS